MGIKAAIFDLDGTLFDSLNLWEKVSEELLRHIFVFSNEMYLSK